MLTFGVIAEGNTDQIVIENLLSGYFGKKEVDVRQVQPPLADPTGNPPPGGWTLVFKALEAGAHKEALSFNDYIVIHIDTDVSERELRYGVPHRDGARELTVDELVLRVKERLKSFIGEEFYQTHTDRLIFAIAVHATECWLLPLYYDGSQAGKITGCLKAVNRALVNKKISLTRGPDGEGKDPRAYREASRDFTRRSRLLQIRDKNPSLALFIRQLDVIAALPPILPSAPPEASEPSA